MAPRKSKTAFDARDQQIVGLKELLKAAQLERENAEGAMSQANDRAQKAEQATAAVRADVMALKRELAAAHEKIALYQGYLARVQEDDILRDGPAHVQISRDRRAGPLGENSDLRPLSLGNTAYADRQASKPWWMR